MHLVAIGGSDAGISAALRARELDPTVDVTVVVADRIRTTRSAASRTTSPVTCTRGSRSPPHPRRPRSDRDAALRLDTLATDIDVAGRRLTVRDAGGESVIAYDELIVGTGALPLTPASPASTASAPTMAST